MMTDVTAIAIQETRIWSTNTKTDGSVIRKGSQSCNGSDTSTNIRVSQYVEQKPQVSDPENKCGSFVRIA